MGWFGRKKEEKKKFDYSEETKELFAEETPTMQSSVVN